MTLSSREAEEAVIDPRDGLRKRKAKLDAAAAAVVLQDYLDARSLTGPRTESRGQKDNEKDTE